MAQSRDLNQEEKEIRDVLDANKATIDSLSNQPNFRKTTRKCSK